tara:strand:- start:777 stop:1196 length:420 start_codon:yes stop_codon:yes gene_type:complete
MKEIKNGCRPIECNDISCKCIDHNRDHKRESIGWTDVSSEPRISRHVETESNCSGPRKTNSEFLQEIEYLKYLEDRGEWLKTHIVEQAEDIRKLKDEKLELTEQLKGIKDTITEDYLARYTIKGNRFEQILEQISAGYL